MFFCAFLGDRTDEPAWRETVNRHAAWLGLTAHLDSRAIADGRLFSFGWVSLHPPDVGDLVYETEEHVTLTTLPVLTQPHGPFTVPRNFETNAIRMEVSLLDGSVRAAVPMVSLEQFFYASDTRGHAFSDDLRLMVRWAGLSLDEMAVFALWEYEDIPAPLTISMTVRRVPPGHLLAVGAAGARPVLQAAFQWSPRTSKGRDAADLVEELRQTLDSTLARVPVPAALAFSGGVDSALLAARLAALGRTETTLLNFSDSPNDTCAPKVPLIAAHLGLPCTRVPWQPSAVGEILANLARDYTLPFGDSATLPSMLLVQAFRHSAERPEALIEGTGTGSLHAVSKQYVRWHNIARVPRPARWLLARAERAAGGWRHDSRLSRTPGMMERSLRIPFPRLSVGGHDSLDGISYSCPPSVHDSIQGIIQHYFDALVQDLDTLSQRSLWCIIQNNAGRSTSKFFDPLRRHGHRLVSPYLEPASVRLGMSLTHAERLQDGEYKALIKRLLAQSVPQEWAFQPNNVFRLPFRETYSNPSLRSFLEEVVLSPQNPLLAFCHTDTVREMAHRAETGLPLSLGARVFLWVLVFTSAWLQQLQAQL